MRKAPWGNPVFSGMFISLIGFGFLGGISGVMMGTEQLNMLIHNTIYVPGHFHATVVVGTTLSFMALTYFLIPVLFRRELIWNRPGLMAAVSVRAVAWPCFRPSDDGRWYAGCCAPPLGHGFQPASALPMSTPARLT